MNGIDQIFRGMHHPATGLAAERVRIDTIAENLANARTTRTPQGGPYRRKLVEFEALMQEGSDGTPRPGGVRAARVFPDYSTPFERVHMPSHPDADAGGWVEFPNVNTTKEMADLMTAMRAYEANLTMQESFVQMAERVLQLLR